MTLTDEMITHNSNNANSQNIINNYSYPESSLFTSEFVPDVTIPGNLATEDVIFVASIIAYAVGFGDIVDFYELFIEFRTVLENLSQEKSYTYIETYIIVYYINSTYIQSAVGSRVVTKEKSNTRPELTVSSTVSIIPYNLHIIDINCYQNNSTKNYITHLVICDKPNGAKNLYNISSLREIGNYAFQDCVKFEGFTDDLGLTIPHSMTKIGDYAFKNCHKIKAINFLNTNSLSIGDYAFQNCTGLTNIIINSNITSIGKSAFRGCSNLRNIIINCNTDNIGENAFLGVPSTYTDIRTIINNSSGKITKERLIYLGFNQLVVNMTLGSFDLIVDDSNTLTSCESDYMNISDGSTE